MPDPHDNAKMTGDTHPPDVESDLPLKDETSDAAGTSRTPRRDRGKATERGEEEDRPGSGNRKSGALKDKDNETGAMRDSGESPDENRG
jgi:hypothetical protein